MNRVLLEQLRATCIGLTWLLEDLLVFKSSDY